jgi:hypothetical protein
MLASTKSMAAIWVELGKFAPVHVAPPSDVTRNVAPPAKPRCESTKSIS